MQISLAKKGKTVKEEYLDSQEVIMRDIAMGKAINLLTPTSSDKQVIYSDGDLSNHGIEFPKCEALYSIHLIV